MVSAIPVVGPVANRTPVSPVAPIADSGLSQTQSNPYIYNMPVSKVASPLDLSQVSAASEILSNNLLVTPQ